MQVLTKERQECRITFQVADISKPLLAVSGLVRSGNKVSFTDTGGAITSRKTGRSITCKRVGGMYVLSVLVAPPKTVGKAGDGPPAQPASVGGASAAARAAGFTWSGC